MKLFFVLLGLTAHLMIGCGSKDKGDPTPPPEETLSETSLEGKINATPWAFKTGYVKPSPFVVGQYSFNFLNIETENPCDVFLFENRYIFGAFPLTAGTYNLSLQSTMTIYVKEADNNINWIVTSGKMLIDEISETKVNGRLLLNYDADNHVNGAFSLTLCK